VAGHLQEFKQQFVATLAGDSTLTDMLASNTAIYYRRPFGSTPFPALFYTVSTAYRPEVQSEGIRDVDLVLAAYGDDPDVLDQIENRLEELLDENPGALSSSSWECGHLRIESSRPRDADALDPETTERLWSNVITFSARLYRK